MPVAVEYIIITILLLLSALFSGLTLGLLSLDLFELRRKASLGDHDAHTIYPIRKKGNLLLVTLTFGNIGVNSINAVFLGTLVPGIIAVVISTLLITIFGQILPQAIFSRFALALGARTIWLTKFFLFILYPVSWPLAYLLDKMLGEELPTIYAKAELLKIIEEHGASKESDVARHEEKIARGALTFGDKHIVDIMTPRSVTFFVEKHAVIDQDLLATIQQQGYSRIPVYDKNPDNIVGMLYLHDLIKSDSNSKTAGQVCEKEVHYIPEESSLDHVLRAFLRTKHHLFVVINKFSEVQGVVSIEDVLEQILGEDILDEFDQFKNGQTYARHQAKALEQSHKKLSRQ